MRTFVREKKIYCGANYLEVDIFNYTKTEEENNRRGKRSKKEQESTLKQIAWNEENSRRRFLQIVHTNFGEYDVHTSLTYANKNLPQTLEEAEREERNFLRRVAYARKKKGLPPLKYISIPACAFKKDGVTPARIHHHIIMSGGLNRDEIEDLWRKRRRRGQKKGDKIGYANADRLQPEENGLAALCEYLAKQTSGKKRWSSSQGLEKPLPDIQDQNDPIPDAPRKNITRISASSNLQRPWSRTNNHSFSRKEVQKIANAPPDPPYWEKRYPGYTLMSEGYGYKAVYSDSRGWALYIKLRRIRN
jgi:ABC-type transporter Mla MlaB component